MINKRSRWGLLAKKTSATMRMPASLSCQCQGRSRDQVVVGRACPWTRLFAVCSADILFRPTRVLLCANSLGRVRWLLYFAFSVSRLSVKQDEKWTSFWTQLQSDWERATRLCVCWEPRKGRGVKVCVIVMKWPWLEQKQTLYNDFWVGLLSCQ